MGHFLGNFYELKNEFFLELDHYFDPEELSEEEISKRIKILKRSLEKIFPSFSKSLDNEFLSINENVTQVMKSFLLKDDSLIKGLTFVGENAPVSKIDNFDSEEISHFVRGIISSGYIENSSDESM